MGVATALLVACDGCEEPPPPVSPVVPVSLRCAAPVSVGDALGNAATLGDGLVVGTSTGVVLVSEAGAKVVDLGAKGVGGVYAHGDRALVLEFGGDRVFELMRAGGTLEAGRTFVVGAAPRLAAWGEGVVRVASRDPDRALSDIDLVSGEVRAVRKDGELAADVKFHRGSFAAAWIHEAKVGSVAVGAEPYRLFSAPSGLYALHAGSGLVTRVDDGKTLELASAPTRLAGDLVALLAGSGRLEVIDDMTIVGSHAVPVGSSDVVVAGGVAVVAAGATGTLTVLGLGDRPVGTASVSVPFSAGRLYADGDRRVWVVGPPSGQVAACALEP